jgi:hypothetical protein
MTKNLSGWMPCLVKQDCWKAVVVAMRKYDRSKYRTVKYDLRHVALLPHENAKAAPRAALRTGRPKFRTALDILEGPAVYELERFKAGEISKPSDRRALAQTVPRMQMLAIQPLDLLPPCAVTFRDYALAVLRAEQVANPTVLERHVEST